MKRDNLRIGDVVVQRDGALGFCFEIGGTVYMTMWSFHLMKI